MKLWAISDLHVGRPENLAGLRTITPRPDDWLILAGDIGDTEQELAATFDVLAPKFARLVWVPGNHELWTRPGPDRITGEDKYRRLVETCRREGVLTPEDPYPLWEGEGGPCFICPLFLLYDYSFAPDGMGPHEALQWALEANLLCTDEHLLSPSPFPSRQAWCHARCDATFERLDALPKDVPTVLVNHFPLRRDHAVLPAVPRFSIWCGTRRTEDWHLRFRARAVVYGHLHIPQTRWQDGVRFEEVSLGYPRQWSRERGADAYLREILPGR